MILEASVGRLSVPEMPCALNLRAAPQRAPVGSIATSPLAHPGGLLALSLLLAGMSLPRRRFAPDTRPNAPTGSSNRGL